MRVNRKRLESLPPEQREQAEQILAQLATLHEQNPLYAYQPHPKQAAFHKARTRTKCFFGGNRSGKTHASVADDLIQAVDASALPPHLLPYKKWQPPFHCRIVSPDFTATMEGVIFQKIRELAPKDQLKGGAFDKAYDKQLRILRFANGSWFQFLTSEQDLDKFSGAALHRVHYDEEPPGEKGRQIRQENLMRLIDHGGDELFSMTPLFGMSWTFHALWEKREKEISENVFEGDDLFIVTVDMDENPHLDQKMKEAVLGEMSSKEREARKQGRFVHFAGLVYDEFNPDVHLTDPPSKEHLKGQDIYVGIDPGLKTTAVVFCAFDGENHMLVFDELYLHEEKAIPEQAARLIRAVERRWDLGPSFYVIDPSARNRSLVNADNVQAAFQRAGIPVTPGQNALEAGVFEIKRRLESRAFLVSRKCETWQEERGYYRIEPREDGEFKTVKQHDHLMDATRYVAMARPWQTTAPTNDEPRRWTPGIAPPLEWLDQREAPAPPLGSMT